MHIVPSESTWMKKTIGLLLDSNEEECIKLAAILWLRVRNPVVQKIESDVRGGVFYTKLPGWIKVVGRSNVWIMCSWDHPTNSKFKVSPIPFKYL